MWTLHDRNANHIYIKSDLQLCVLCTMCTKWKHIGLTMYYVCLSVGSHYSTQERLHGFCEMWYGRYAIGGHPKPVLFLIFCNRYSHHDGRTDMRGWRNTSATSYNVLKWCLYNVKQQHWGGFITQHKNLNSKKIRSQESSSLPHSQFPLYYRLRLWTCIT
jgi:hypothetical protein